MEKNIYLVPVSIIVAGALIGGGLWVGLRGAGEPTPPKVRDTKEMAKAAGVDVKKLEACMKAKTYTQKVNDDAVDAIAAGGQGTPYSIVIDAKGNKIPVSGAYPYDNMKAIVDGAIKGTPGPVPAKNDIAFRPITEKDHILGPNNAPVTILEYSDLECPFCHRFHPTMQQILKDYNGKVRWVYRHFPLTQIHPEAQPRAEASECAAEQGKFWELIDQMMQN